MKIRRLLKILAGLVIAFAVALTTLLNWPLPAMPRPGVTGDFLVRNVALVDVVNGGILPGRDVVGATQGPGSCACRARSLPTRRLRLR